MAYFNDEFDFEYGGTFTENAGYGTDFDKFTSYFSHHIKNNVENSAMCVVKVPLLDYSDNLYIDSWYFLLVFKKDGTVITPDKQQGWSSAINVEQSCFSTSYRGFSREDFLPPLYYVDWRGTTVVPVPSVELNYTTFNDTLSGRFENIQLLKDIRQKLPFVKICNFQLIWSWSNFATQTEPRNVVNFNGCPVFDNFEDVKKYVNTGAYDKPIHIDYKLWIDGTKSPSYALEWDTVGMDEETLNSCNIKITFESVSKTLLQKSGEYFDTTNVRNEVYRFNFNNVFNKLDAKALLDNFYNNRFSIKIQLVRNNDNGETTYNDYVGVTLMEYGTPLWAELKHESINDDTLIILSGQGSKTDKTGKEYPPNDQNDGKGGNNKNPNSEEDDSQDTNNGSKDDITNRDKTPSDEHTSTESYDIGAVDLMSIYKMNIGRLNNLSTKLWSDDFFDNIKLLNNSPIENIVSCKLLPCVVHGTDSPITIGNVDIGVNGEKLSNSCVEISIGSISLQRKADYGFLNYAPYTSVNIFLPFIGFKELDTNVVMGNTIHVKYIIDLITGGCKAVIGQGGYEIATFDGNCAIDIPLTSNNRSQVEVGYITSALGGIASIGTGNVLGATMSAINCARQEFHSETKGAYNGSLGAYEDRTCYLIVNQPMYTKISSFGHTKGYKCQLSKKIGNCNGFVKTTENVDLSGVNAPMECKEEILKLLSSGVYV